MQDRAEYVASGLDTNVFEIDREVRFRLDGRPDVTYLSLLDQLCRGEDRGCLARVPGEGDLDLMSLDHGHLTPKGSSYLGRLVWKAYLERIIR
jgi:hypothetical protein